ncbi:LacI family DNA-binding transcriptional regulator [Paracoccus sediminicola]|uniref:LacI family DNA-binding transcriptional regulator n=1 Tax=Paracoccus sediminicola TaxID=3017783 RepID=UPI0022EFE366|nr:LacI family DNA-binding transcriptional regulator [Paracoccus sediminicola]WBU56259.1 LacI family DNA-binding transcriptional regulator [Paracoccus sediminicola]
MLKKVTLDEVARAAGVSRATVSLVVRSSPLVADQTRRKVQQVLEDMDYVRDIGAARLRNNSSRTVGIIVPNLVNSFFTEFLSGVEQVMCEDDRVVLLANSHDNTERQNGILQRFRGHGVDGVILCPAEGTNPALLARMRQWRMPVVQSLREVGDRVTDYAGADYIEGVGLAVRHLIDMGHRRIAFLSVKARTSAREERLAGFFKVLKETNAESAGIVEADLTWEGAAQSARDLLDLSDPPSAVLCFNDVLAAGLMLGLRRMNCEPGRDMAVVGLDDLAFSQLTYPPLTSVAMQPEKIGNAAARLLTRRLREAYAAPERSVLPPRLVIRASSQRQSLHF